MGILTGLFKTMMLTRMINAKQHRLTQVMSKITRKQRESSQAERMFGNRLNAAKQMIRANFNANLMLFKQTGGNSCVLPGANGYAATNPSGVIGGDEALLNQYAQQNAILGAGADNKIDLRGYYQFYQQSQVRAYLQQQMQAELEDVTQQIEDEKEMYLEDLKDEETQLENEKAQLETQIKMYEQWKQASQEETQSSIKNFKPLGSSSSYG